MGLVVFAEVIVQDQLLTLGVLVKQHNENASIGRPVVPITCFFPGVCGKIVKDRAELSRHLRVHNSNEKRKVAAQEAQNGGTGVNGATVVHAQRPEDEQHAFSQEQSHTQGAGQDALMTGDYTRPQRGPAQDVHHSASSAPGRIIKCLLYVDVWKLTNVEGLGPSSTTSNQPMQVNDFFNTQSLSIIMLTSGRRRCLRPLVTASIV